MNVSVDGDYVFSPGKVIEIMGHLLDENTLQVRCRVVCGMYHPNGTSFLIKHMTIGYFSLAAKQHFISRQLGDEMALEVYNDMISQVYSNPKYKSLFNAFA